VTATFNEPMASATISGSTFLLRDASSNLVPATVPYNASTNVATLAPTWRRRLPDVHLQRHQLLGRYRLRAVGWLAPQKLNALHRS
jgi:hypothetical protein